MGCDIHMHTENFHDGRWVRVAGGPYDWRDYDLFWLLGGITRRPSDIQPIGPGRGIPEDASPEVKADHYEWSVDAHSASWLSLKELDRFLEQHPEQRDESGFWSSLDGIRGCLVHEDCKAHPELGRTCLDGRTEHVRIVFWFDN
jgi:hypothetical protein